MNYAVSYLFRLGFLVNSNLKLEIKEQLHIAVKKPSLNKQVIPQSKFIIRALIIAVYPQFTNETDES